MNRFPNSSRFVLNGHWRLILWTVLAVLIVLGTLALLAFRLFIASVA